MVLPTYLGFWQGFAGQKVKVPAIPQGMGVVTKDWYISSIASRIVCFSGTFVLPPLPAAFVGAKNKGRISTH